MTIYRKDHELLNHLLMTEDFAPLDEQEKLKAENDFLKMKIMLEHGGRFHEANSEHKLPPDVENEFLNSIIEFEKKFENRKTVKIFDKIGRPQHFKSVDTIPDEQITEAYDEVQEHLAAHGIGFDVCSPNVSKRELYRFITEELFEEEIDEVDVPGWTTNFIYDEFYPDEEFDNSTDAEACMSFIFSTEQAKFPGHFIPGDIQLNNYHFLSEEQLNEILFKFKLWYEELHVNEIKISECLLDQNDCTVRGSYNVQAIGNRKIRQISGSWEIIFKKNEWNFWYITNIQIPDVEF